MAEQEGVATLYSDDFYRVFKRKDVGRIRSFLREHDVDVNACTIALDPKSKVYSTVMVFALVFYDRAVMMCLLDEFGADLDVPCYIGNDPQLPLRDYPVFQACVANNAEEAVEFVLDHGASPLAVSYGVSDNTLDRFALTIIEAAKDRLRTAWAAAWSLSHHPVLRDMAQPVAQRVMTTPVREFLKEDNTARNKRKKI